MVDFIQVKEDLLLVHEVEGGLLRRTPYLESIPFFTFPVRILQSFIDYSSIELASPRLNCNLEPSIRQAVLRREIVTSRDESDADAGTSPLRIYPAAPERRIDQRATVLKVHAAR